MDPFVSAWASQFYARGLGFMEIPQNVTEDVIKTEYTKYFEEPAKRFLKTDTLSSKQAKDFLAELKNRKLYAALYVLSCLPYVDKGNWKESLKESVKQFTDSAQAYYGIYTNSNSCIVCYVDVNACCVLGNYPALGTLYPLIPLYTKGVNGMAFNYLYQHDPITMTEQEITAVEYLIECDAITREQLNTSMFYMPDGSTRVVTCLELKDIPYKVRMLVKALPASLVKEHAGDVYSAAKSFASSQADNYAEELLWLQNLGSDTTVSETPAELNDDTVKAYLVERYGMNPDVNLGALFSTPKQFLSGDNLASKIKEEGVDAVLDKASEDPDYLTGTLDELISDYCKEEGIDTRCTISQLIHYINYDVQITPPSVSAVLGDFISNNPNFPMDTTVEEILIGTPHKYVDDFTMCMEFIDSCDNIDAEIKRSLRNALLNNTELKMPNGQITDTDIVEAIEARSIPEETKLLMIGIIEGTVSAEDLSKPVRNDGRVLSTREQSIREAANYILNGFRDYLLRGDTDAKRIAGQTILYSYMKILYAGRSSVEADKQFLLDKLNSCTDEEVKAILREAINLYAK